MGNARSWSRHKISEVMNILTFALVLCQQMGTSVSCMEDRLAVRKIARCYSGTLLTSTGGFPHDTPMRIDDINC